MDYEQFFGLKDTPFRLTPDPDYYFPSEVHNEALQTLMYSVRAREGFIQITGDPGTGKTLTLRTLLKHLGDEVTTALILNPRLNPEELLKVILEDLGISPIKMEERSKEELLRFFRDILLEKAAAGSNTVLIIDEAQNLPDDTLEELRLLSNLETEKKKLLQIILVGQLELEDKLKGPHLKQLDQRITIRYRLKPLNKSDTISYIHHRLRVAGGSDSAKFSPRVLNEVYKVSRGVPRLINIICERALMAAFVDGKNTIEQPHFKKAMASIVGEKRLRRGSPSRAGAGGRLTTIVLGILVVLALAGVGYQFYQGSQHQSVATVQTPSSPPPPPSKQSGLVKGFESEYTAPKPEALPMGNPTHQPQAPPQQAAVDQTAQAAPEVPAPPAEAYYVPAGQYFLSVNRDTRMSYLWEGNDPAPILKGEFNWGEPLPDGLFVLGETINKKQFFFNYPLFFWKGPKLPSENLWMDLSKVISGNMLPVVAHSPRRQPKQDQLDRARVVRSMLKDWADAWRAKDIDRLLSYYTNVFTTYYDTDGQPKVYSKDELYKIKNDVFKRSGAISLTISDPICILDPGNPELMMVVFHQKYVSEIYSDEGTKALYLSLVPNPDNGDRIWKIAAKLWVPLMETGPGAG